MIYSKPVGRLLLFLFLVQIVYPVIAQDKLENLIVGIWSKPYKTATSEGLIILDFAADRRLRITNSVVIDNISNAAFIQEYGTWRLEGSNIRMSISSTGGIKWTAGIAEQLAEFDISREKTSEILMITEKNMPSLRDLHISNLMHIRSINAKNLTIADENNPSPITLSRRNSYPKGGKISVPPQSKTVHGATLNPQATLNGVKNDIIRQQKQDKLDNVRAELNDALTTLESTKLLYEKQIVTKSSYENALKAYKTALANFAAAGGDVRNYPTDILLDLGGLEGGN